MDEIGGALAGAFRRMMRIRNVGHHALAGGAALSSSAVEKPCSAASAAGIFVPVAGIADYVPLLTSPRCLLPLCAHGDTTVDDVFGCDQGSRGGRNLHSHRDVLFDDLLDAEIDYFSSTRGRHNLRAHSDILVDNLLDAESASSRSHGYHNLRAHGDILLDDVPSAARASYGDVLVEDVPDVLLLSSSGNLHPYTHTATASSTTPRLAASPATPGCYALCAVFASCTLAMGFSQLDAYSFHSAMRAWNYAQMGAPAAVGCSFPAAVESSYIPISTSRRGRSRHAIRMQATGGAGFSTTIGTNSWSPSLRISSTNVGAARLRARAARSSGDGSESPERDRVIKIALLCLILQSRNLNLPTSDKKDDKQILKNIVNLVLLAVGVFIGSSAAKGDKKFMFTVSLFDGSMKSYKILSEIALLVISLYNSFFK
uniref:Uncharacterized protein n=1 Tax=Leersia perrieri TaxID=77586 RepID=A0A0D9XF78_9ORYZ